jgi:nicotinamide-nucleotide amidase
MTTPVTIELFIIGNELLIGEIQDTNTHWLCRELNRLGGQVVRATLLRDAAPVIAAEIRAAMARAPRLIITSGGLGPTADDLTLAAVAQGLDRELLLHDQARQMVRRRYDELTAQGALSQGGLNPAREKMAWLPAGAEPLHNPVGTAPAVLVESGQTAIISLPGVPSELKGIFATSLQPFLRNTFLSGLSVLRTLTVQCNDESLMEPVLSRVASDHPAVYVKSLATTIDENREIDITLTATGQDEQLITDLLLAASHDLQAGLTALGIGLREKETAAPG